MLRVDLFMSFGILLRKLDFGLFFILKVDKININKEEIRKLSKIESIRELKNIEKERREHYQLYLSLVETLSQS